MSLDYNMSQTRPYKPRKPAAVITPVSPAKKGPMAPVAKQYAARAKRSMMKPGR